MGLLSSGSDDRITQDEAEYEGGRIVCPRCGYNDPQISQVGGRSRKLSCINCGYASVLADGVLLYKDSTRPARDDRTHEEKVEEIQAELDKMKGEE